MDDCVTSGKPENSRSGIDIDTRRERSGSMATCLIYSFPSDLAGVKNLNRCVYPRRKAADYHHLLAIELEKSAQI